MVSSEGFFLLDKDKILKFTGWILNLLTVFVFLVKILIVDWLDQSKLRFIWRPSITF